MNERQIKQLYKLLGDFRAEKETNDAGEKACRDTRVTRMITEMMQWVKWHAHDEMSVDL